MKLRASSKDLNRAARLLAESDAGPVAPFAARARAVRRLDKKRTQEREKEKEG
eukprot:CAMPEP_0117582804 /NCGR_PEP_ID=MMETSP0784-20121206/66641_1 /TAXON_ID=39447 /ORGANISM="" /LENGTH=52 /DNA_ID=CAMNT_0005383377 /DNA_START=57 /DNA_END=212 /DNA_ORIENTATION=+